MEHGFLEGFLAVNANGPSEEVVVAWNETVLSKVDSKTWQFSMEVKLKRQSDDFDVIMILICDQANIMRRTKLWGKLAKVAAAWHPLALENQYPKRSSLHQ